MIDGKNFEDINFLVGINGSGKSRCLNRLAEIFNSKDYNILEISNTVFDRFYFSSKKIKKLKINNDKNFFLKSLLSVFGRSDYDRANDDIYKQLKFIANGFEYIGFSSEIKIELFVKGYKEPLNFFDIDLDFLINESKKYYKNSKELDFLIDDFKEIAFWGRNFSKKDGLIFNFDEDHYYTNNLKKFSKLFSYFNNISFINLFFSLKKNGIFIPVESVSSGELHMLLNIIFIASNIDTKRKNIILIDEPEVSLHPKWQKDYVIFLYDYFYLYDCQFFFATHSPLIISKIQYQKNINYNIFKLHGGDAVVVVTDNDLSIESLYWEVFRVLTPQSAFLSRHLVELMSKMDNLSLDNISKLEVNYKLILSELGELCEASFSDKQKEVIEKVIKEYK